MSINLVIAVTDGDWFDLLRGQPNLAEVNFWAPSAANFHALQPASFFCSNCTHRATSSSVAASSLTPMRSRVR
jgi:hypothetical protein